MLGPSREVNCCPGCNLRFGWRAAKFIGQFVRRSIELNQPDASDALDVLAKVGGLEIAGLVGVVIGAASAGVPVVSDGYISGAATLVALRMAPAATPSCQPWK